MSDYVHPVVYIPKKSKLDAIRRIVRFFNEYVDEEFIFEDLLSKPPTGKDLTITVNVYDIDFYGDILTEFVSILPDINMISFEGSGEDSVIMKIRVNDVWEVSTI